MSSISVIITILCLALPVLSPAEEGDEPLKPSLYQWTDDRGGVHVTDSLQKVPERHRSSVKRMLERSDDPAGTPAAPPEVLPQGDYGPGSGGDEESQKQGWQRRIRDARQRLRSLTERREALLQEKEEVYRSGGVTTTYGITPDAKQKLDRIEKDLAEVDRQAKQTEQEITVDIPEEARRAGVPPGWLRE